MLFLNVLFAETAPRMISTVRRLAMDKLNAAISNVSNFGSRALAFGDSWHSWCFVHSTPLPPVLIFLYNQGLLCTECLPSLKRTRRALVS